MKKVKVKAPATVANLVCGFDILGLCLDDPYDFMEVTLLNERKVVIESSNGYVLPLEPENNTAGAPLIEMLKEVEGDIGFHILIDKNIKPGSGVGSSAASASGAVIAANYLLNNRFNKTDLVRFALFGEKVASGVKHADNIAPGIYGGLTLIRSIFPLDIVCLPTPDLFVTLVHPQIEVKTSDARQILRKEVLLKDAIRQWGNIAGLVAGFVQNDLDLIGRSLEDVIIEPVRSILIPGFDKIKSASKQVGAIGGGISGSGPSIFMLSADESTARNIETQMKQIYSEIDLPFHTYVTRINKTGVTIIEKE